MAQSQINTYQINPTTAQLAQLPPAEQAKYYAAMSPAMQAVYMKEQTISANRRFMRQSLERTAYCPVTGGSGTTATYTAGNTIYFDLPKVPGYAKALLIHYNLTVTPAAGTGATYGVNKAAPFNIFQQVQLNYNGTQINTYMYFAAKVLDQLRGYQTGAQNAVLAGNNDSTIAANIVGGTPIVIGAANTWQGSMLLRLNALGEDTVPGVLPANGVGNTPQLQLTCVPNFIGQDPLLNPIAPIAGTGHSGTTVTGTVNVDMIYLDGSNMDNVNPLQLAWQAEPTLQYTRENPLTPFNAGSTLQTATINSKLKHWYVVSIVIDGNQANQFCNLSNLTSFELSPDAVGQQNFVAWNVANNISIYDFFDRYVRRPFGQDMDDGVLPWVAGPGRGIINASNRNGIQWLNMTQSGFPAATALYTVGSVGGQGVIDGYPVATPRVETFLVSENPAGLTVR